MKKLTIGLILLIAILFTNNTYAQNYFTSKSNGLPAAKDIDVADYDNDNDLDVLTITVSTGISYVNIYTNNGSGTFSLLSGTSFSSNVYFSPDAKFIDIDGDNDQDVVITGISFSPAAGIKIYRNDGGSTFTLLNTYTDIAFSIAELAVGDLNNDNIDDFIAVGVPSSGSQTYSAFINNGSGTFSYSLNSGNSPLPITQAKNLAITKLDNDNFNDILIPGEDHNELDYHLNNGTTIAGAFTLTTANRNGTAADVDGDGDNDIIGNDGTATRIWLNDGSGNFSLSSNTFPSIQPGVIVAGDIDNDGDIDIYRKGQNSGGTAYEGGLYINDGSGNFFLNNSISTADVAEGTAFLVDLNGDTYRDLLIADISGAIHYYENTFTTNHPSDRALDFDGVNLYTANHNTALNTLPITIEFWLQGGNHSEGILDKATGLDGFQIGKVGVFMRAIYELDASNYVRIDNEFLINDANWHHIAVVVETSGMKLYGDGALIKTATWTGTAGAITNTADLRFGRYSKDVNFFSGNLDEVRIWNTARSQADIVNNYCSTISNPASNANLVAYYTMDDYLDNTQAIFDGSSNRNHLTLSGGTQTLVAQQTGCTPPALPVEFISFAGYLENDNVILNWVTATEENNYGFEIERSSNGTDWETIGFEMGNGTTTEISNYEFIDNKSSNDNNYYRLKQIDYDGKYEYSNIVNITPDSYRDESSGNEVFNIFPNPASDVLNIETEEPTIIQIINTTGQILIEEQVNADAAISIKDLPNGIYYIRIGMHTEKFIIQK